MFHPKSDTGQKMSKQTQTDNKIYEEQLVQNRVQNILNSHRTEPDASLF
jgi:hypothetical protein